MSVVSTGPSATAARARSTTAGPATPFLYRRHRGVAKSKIVFLDPLHVEWVQTRVARDAAPAELTVRIEPKVGQDLPLADPALGDRNADAVREHWSYI